MLRKRIAATALALTTVGGLGLATTTSANAAPIGDGITAPSHEPDLAVGNVCRPLSWLIANFGDHNRDIAVYKLNANSAQEIAAYAKADIIFHGQATWPALFGFADPAKYCLMDYGVWDDAKAKLAASNTKVASDINALNAKIAADIAASNAKIAADLKASVNRTRALLGLPALP